MKQPFSISSLVFFAGWSVLEGFESLLRPASSKLMFSEYGITFLYYLFILISTIGGIALCYGLIKRLSWSYTLGIVWLIIGIIYMGFTTIVSLVNKNLMSNIMMITGKAKGRSMNNLTDFLNSPTYTVSICLTAIVMIGIMSLFIYKIRKHRNYLSVKSNH